MNLDEAPKTEHPDLTLEDDLKPAETGPQEVGFKTARVENPGIPLASFSQPVSVPEIESQYMGRVESAESMPAIARKALGRNVFLRMWDIRKDERVQKALGTFGRLGLNFALSGFEWMPGGTVSDGAADSMKLFKLVSRHALDVTPAVSVKEAIALEVGKLVTCGLLPAHAIETCLELYRRDGREMLGALQAFWEALMDRQRAIKDLGLRQAAAEFTEPKQ